MHLVFRNRFIKLGNKTTRGIFLKSLSRVKDIPLAGEIKARLISVNTQMNTINFILN